MSPNQSTSNDKFPEQVRYQWFWAGTQNESRRLSPDLRHAVKRHVVVKRIVPEELIFSLKNQTAQPATTTSSSPENPTNSPSKEEEKEETIPNGQNPAPTSTNNANETAKHSWTSLLDFNFSVHVCTSQPPNLNHNH